MSIILEHPIKPITTWQCGCRPESMRVGLSHKTCPYCHRPMPQSVSTNVYIQVLHELRAEVVKVESARWSKVNNFTLRNRRLLRILAFAAVAAWCIILAIKGVRQVPGIAEKVPELNEIFLILWQKISRMGKTLFDTFSENLQDDRWAELWDKIKSFPLRGLLQRLMEVVTTFFRIIGLIISRILNLFQLIFSFISSLFL